METYLYKWTYDSLLVDHRLGVRNKYTFMLDIFKESPDLIDGYLTFFKNELQMNDKEIRFNAISMFAKLFGMGPINLAIRHPEIWELYLQRFYDRYGRVRKLCVKSSPDIVKQWPQLFDDLMEHIADIQGDTSSIIRLEIITALETIAIGNFDLVSSNNEFWEVLKTRSRDVEKRVRKKVKLTLFKLYYNYIKNSRIEPVDQDQVNWIVQELHLWDND